MSFVKNKDLSRMFAEIADALEFKGDNRFKILAYKKAATVLDELPEDVAVLVSHGKLERIPGIGKGIAKNIEEYLATGHMERYNEALSGIPNDLLKLLKIQGLGPKTLILAHRELDVKNLQDLLRVINDGSLANLFGMGDQKVKNIRQGIDVFIHARERIPISEAVEISEDIIDYLKKCPKINRVAPAGSLRRMKESVGDIDILATADDGAASIAYFLQYPKADKVLASGVTKASLMVTTKRDARQVDLRIVSSDAYGAALQYFTGSKAHNIRLRSMAKDKGLKINEYGVFDGENKIAGETENAVYKMIGLPFIPPELREDRGEIEAAAEGNLPKLVQLSDIKGDLHVHSTYSDGHSTLREIASQATFLNYDYIAICDHSKSMRYAGGLTEDQLQKQMEEIEKLDKEFTNVRVLKGIEVDVLGDGNLDLDLELLAQLDVVVAAVHMGFKKNVTQRLCTALENPHVDIIAHPTGRLISKRVGYDVDIDEIMAKAKEHDKMLELNAYPDRLDLGDVQLRKVKAMKVKVSIGTDAHSVSDMKWMRFGVGTARRGWLEKKDVVNTLDVAQLKKTLRI